jgi:aspartyl-tRNA(Asn)/glutamyl-tRNA(Gln) amidotransferase subunit B
VSLSGRHYHGALNFLVGQVMQQTGGSADPGEVNQLLREELD